MGERERERVKECGEIEFFVEKGLLLGKNGTYVR